MARVGGDENSVGKKNSALDGDKEEELGAGWEERGGYQEGVFYYFLLMVGRGKKNQNSDSIPAQINVCSLPASRGRLGQADLKGQREERRGWGEETGLKRQRRCQRWGRGRKG